MPADGVVYMSQHSVVLRPIIRSRNSTTAGVFNDDPLPAVQSDMPAAVEAGVVPYRLTRLPPKNGGDDGSEFSTEHKLQREHSCINRRTSRTAQVDERAMTTIVDHVQSPRPAEKAYRRRRRRAGTSAGLISTSILMIHPTGKAACASASSTPPMSQARAAAVPAASKHSQRQLAGVGGALGFVPGVADISRCRRPASNGEEADIHDSGVSAWRRRRGELSRSDGGDSSRFTRSSTRSFLAPSRTQIIEAAGGATGNDHWSLHGQQPTGKQQPSSSKKQQRQSDRAPVHKRRAGRSSKKHLGTSADGNGGGGDAGGGREEMPSVTTTATTVAGKNESAEADGRPADLSTWMPRREGQGSWDKWQAKAKLPPPMWEMDLTRGVSVGDVTMSQVSFSCVSCALHVLRRA